MLRRLMLAALALCAMLALESCGVNRLAAPQLSGDDKPAVLGKNQPVAPPLVPPARRLDGHPRDGDGTPTPNVDPTVGASPTDVDTLSDSGHREL